MANWYVSSNGYLAVTQWSAGEAVTTGTIRRQLAAVALGNERCFRCTTPGTTGGSEPAWNLGLDATTNDNGVVWTECTGQEAYQSAGNWTAPAATLDLILSSGGRAAVAGTDNIYVANDHSESWSSGRTWNKLGTAVCVQVAGSSLPPGTASESTGAVVTTTGTAGIGLGRSGYFGGIAFNTGTGASSTAITIGTTAAPGTVVMENCQISLVTTHAAARIGLGTTGIVSHLVLVNTALSFGNAAQGVVSNTAGCMFGWYDTPSNGILGTPPNNLLILGALTLAEISGVDLSAITGNIVQTNGGSNTFTGNVVVTGCRLGATTALASNLRTMARMSKLVMTNCDNTTGNSIAGSAYGAVAASGGILSNLAIYRNGGASAGTGSPYSWIIDASSNTNGSPTYQGHPITPPILFWNTDTGAPRTITVHGIANKSALPTNLVVFLELQYLGSAASPQVSSTNGSAGPLAPVSATNTTATTENWSDGVTARSNGEVISTLGTARKVASNPGRVFFCTTTGTCAGAEPAGYASAVDGGSVTDGTAVFRAGYRFSMSLTVTPEKEGWMGALVHYLDQQATVTAMYIDPMAVAA